MSITNILEMVDQHKTITYPGAFDAIVSVGRPSGTQFQRESDRPVAESGLGHMGNHEWDTVHVITEHAVWRALLHHFYEPFPVVEHYQLVS